MQKEWWKGLALISAVCLMGLTVGLGPLRAQLRMGSLEVIPYAGVIVPEGQGIIATRVFPLPFEPPEGFPCPSPGCGIILDQRVDVNPSFLTGFRLLARLTPDLSAAFGFGFSPLSLDGTVLPIPLLREAPDFAQAFLPGVDRDGQLYQFTADLLLDVSPREGLPYFILGAGYTQLSLDLGDFTSFQEEELGSGFTVDLGVGVEVPRADRLALRLEARDFIRFRNVGPDFGEKDLRTLHDLAFQVGVGVRF